MYGLSITLGILLSVLLTEQKIKVKKLDTDFLWALVFRTLLWGFIGARIYHVVDYWEVYSSNPLAIFAIWKGGLGIIGGLIFGLVSTILTLKKHKQEIFVWTDIFAVAVPLGQAIGRWGNYFNKELLPYAIYESGADIILFGILYFINSKKPPTGTVTFSYLMGYSAIRFILEPLKTYSWQINNVNVAQSISLLVIFISLAGLWKIPKTKKLR